MRAAHIDETKDGAPGIYVLVTDGCCHSPDEAARNIYDAIVSVIESKYSPRLDFGFQDGEQKENVTVWDYNVSNDIRMSIRRYQHQTEPNPEFISPNEDYSISTVVPQSVFKQPFSIYFNDRNKTPTPAHLFLERKRFMESLEQEFSMRGYQLTHHSHSNGGGFNGQH